MTATPTRAFPIEVRYWAPDSHMWKMYSRHRSEAAAERAFQELRRDYDEVQMRDDINGRGVLRSHDRRAQAARMDKGK